MSDPRISRKTASTALVYLNELLNYVHDTPEDLEECMVELEKARDTNPCICGCCDGSDCGQLSAAHLTGPPGCRCEEEMRKAGWTHSISCDNCSAIRI